MTDNHGGVNCISGVKGASPKEDYCGNDVTAAWASAGVNSSFISSLKLRRIFRYMLIAEVVQLLVSM